VNEDVARSYVELGLRLGRHIDGLVDAYHGPPELAEMVEAEELRAPTKLVADATRLLESLDRDGLEPLRRKWLRTQLVGLETVARRLAGEEISFEDEVERCYGVRPRRVPEAEFETAHRELDAALPGSGLLAERYQAWRERDTVPGDDLSGLIDGLAEELHNRTNRLVGLPTGESVEFDYVSDEPWAAFNYYLGDLRSRIAINTDSHLNPTFVVELVAHETYPGHHTERAWKEQKLVREGGQIEETILMVGTPQALVAEGIAGLAVEMALGEEEQELTAAHVASTGVAYDPEVSRAVQNARRPLEGVGGNVALLLHADGGSLDEAKEYFRRWSLSSESRADRQVKFISDPLWRSYVTTYADGYNLCREFVQGDPGRFKRLLTEQLTPADLV
jgi:hypothetical protein